MSNNYFKTGIIFCLICFSHGLYEDQVGKFDWKQSYVGKVKYSHIDNHGKRVFLATENNVVASLNLVDGSLLWRKVLETDELGEIHGLSVGSEVVTLSGSGLVRGWNLKSGVLLFEWVIPSESNAQWSLDNNKVYQVRFLDGSLEVFAYHTKSGNPVGTIPKTVPAPWISSQSKCTLDKGFVLCVSPDLKAYAYSLSDSSLVSSIIPAPAGSFLSASLTPVSSPYPAAVLGSTRGESEVLIVAYEGSVLSQQATNCFSYAIRRTANAPVLVCASHNSLGYELQGLVFGEIPGKASLGKPIEVVHNTKLPKGTISSLTDLSPDLLNTIYLIVGEDDSLILVEKDKVEWIREEALANVIAAEMVDLPVSDEEAAIEKEFGNKEGGVIGMFIRRIHSQVMQVVNFFTNILGLKQPSEDSILGLRKDKFGLHKLIVLVTKSSKVYGLENDRGEIVWQFYLEDLTPFTVLGKKSVPFFIHRTGRHFSLPSLASLILKDKATGQSAIYAFNPINGQPLYGGLMKLGFKIKQSVLLPKEDSEFIKGLVVVSEEDRVEVFPPSSHQVALDLHRFLYIFTVSPEDGVLNGYTFTRPTPNELSVVKVWNVRLSPPIIEIGIKNKAERVHSQGRVLGDRSVLYKYINPHLIAVATATTDPVHKNLVTIFLIDSVSGAVIFSAAHKRAVPPVFIVHSENWVVYSFFNDKSRRTEVISLDLYEGKFQRNSTVFSSVAAVPLDPFIERQAYIFPHNILTMRETITEKGITNKHVLVGVSTGSVLEVPWALLDPHRSPDGREEGVLPYTPDLVLPHEAILTYNHTLPLISGILTSPSGLESTSLVLIYGLDLFYTRVAPSKTFDVLKDDFEYWLITLVLGGLISAAYISKRLASRKALRQAWK